jgi:hypothetical protein
MFLLSLPSLQQLLEFQCASTDHQPMQTRVAMVVQISLTSVAYHTIYHTRYGERLQKTELSVLGGLLSGCGWALASEIDEGAAPRAGS